MIRNKYGVAAKDRRTSSDGKLFPSRVEMIRYEELLLLKQAGTVNLIIRQPRIELGADTTYRPDFFVIDVDGYFCFEDVKGTETREFKRIRKLWLKYGPCALHVLKRKGSGWDIERLMR